VFCSGVLEHVDDYHKTFAELTRVSKPGGILLLGLPFRQALHLIPHDYWRFTEYGIRHLLRKSYEILDLAPLDLTVPDCPTAYWTKVRKNNGKDI
jgi:ubiquinone/menaquinone biosynthesis C-methylase UbiE